ncbi:MAG: CotH kinase family protein [Polyangiaceae bacterium]|nr:CotH kinase family protein [Polyangiaceae bacterium]
MKLSPSTTARHGSSPLAGRSGRRLAVPWRRSALPAVLVLCAACSSHGRSPTSTNPDIETPDASTETPDASTETPDASTGTPDGSTETPDGSNEPTDSEIFDDAIAHEFIIEISQEEWEGITQDMLDYAEEFPLELFYDGDGREYRTDNYRKADFIYRRSDGTEIKLTQVGIRSRGNESRRLPYQNGQYYKSHFKVKFDETFDLPADDTATEVLSKRRFAGLKALNFKWSRYNTWDSYANQSKINELFSYGLLGEIGVNAPRMSMGTLTFRIAGSEVDYGLYGIVEPVDKPFLKRRYGASDGDLYKCLYLELEGGPDLSEESLAGDHVGVKDVATNYRPIYDLKTNETTSDHSALKDFVHQLNTLEGQQFVDYMEANFDVDRFVRYLAMGIYISNLDDYRFLANNYYLFFDTQGKIEFIPYDFDISLGTNWHGEMEYEEFIDQDIFDTKNLTTNWGDDSPRPLVDKVLAVETYRERYVKYLQDYILPANELFLFSEYQAKFDQLFALYGDKTANDTMDPDPMGLAGYEQEYFFDKTKNVLDQLQLGYAGYEVE